MKNLKIGRKKKNTKVEELDLAPMLSLMIAIIPMILASAVIFKIRIFDSSVFPASDKVMQKDGADERPITFLDFESTSKLIVLVKKNDKILFRTTKTLASLHGTLKALKLKYPDMKSLKVESNSSVAYKDLIKVFDIAKTPTAENETDEKTSLYDDVTLDDIFKG